MAVCALALDLLEFLHQLLFVVFLDALELLQPVEDLLPFLIISRFLGRKLEMFAASADLPDILQHPFSATSKATRMVSKRLALHSDGVGLRIPD